MPVTVVTDSTAYLPAELHRGPRDPVVPLEVGWAIGSVARAGLDTPSCRPRWRPDLDVQTSRPSLRRVFLRFCFFCFCLAIFRRRLLPAGAGHPGLRVVSVHLSRELSGPGSRPGWRGRDRFGSGAGVDSRATGMGLVVTRCWPRSTPPRGTAARPWRRRRPRWRPMPDVLLGRHAGPAAPRWPDRCRSRRPRHRTRRETDAARLAGTHRAAGEGRGRPPPAAATVWSSWPCRPRRRAVDLAVHHLAAAERANESRPAAARIPQVARLLVSEVGAVIGAHVGPGCWAWSWCHAGAAPE